MNVPFSKIIDNLTYIYPPSVLTFYRAEENRFKMGQDDFLRM